jgi:hypothetical protein
MYQLTIPGNVFTVSTLAGIFSTFDLEPLQATDTALIEVQGGPVEVRITRYNGKLAIRLPGTVAEIVASIFDELHSLWQSTYGQAFKPWQVRRSHWNLLFSLFELTRRPERFLSTDQIEAGKLAGAGRLALDDLFEAAAIDRFGFGGGGPRTPTGHVNGRHEVHLAYALLANEPVPDPVVEEYRRDAEPFRHDLQWAKPLLEVPELRGAMAPLKLQVLASVMRIEKLPITGDNVSQLVAALEDLSDNPTFAQVDDALFAAGVLASLDLPAMFQQPVNVGQPVSPLAQRLRQLNADDRREKSLAHARKELEEGRIGLRRFEQERAMTVLSYGRETFEWSNRIATALEQRDVVTLLSVLDSADDWNVRSKQVVHEFYGIKLRGLKARARRRAVFALCDMDEAAQAAWEAAEQTRREAQRVAEEGKRAKESAEATRYRRADGSVVSGVQHVDESIAAGFCEIRDWRKGASRQYALVNPESREARTLRAKDGTLAYARSTLERRAA